MLGRLSHILRLLRDRSGQAAVEFAFIAPTFFLIMFGVMDFGRAMWINSTIEHAAAEGARYAAIRGPSKPTVATTANVTAFVQNRATGLDSSQLTVNVTWDPANVEGGTVTVRVGYPYQFLMAGFLPIDPIPFGRSSTMVIN